MLELWRGHTRALHQYLCEVGVCGVGVAFKRCIVGVCVSASVYRADLGTWHSPGLVVAMDHCPKHIHENKYASMRYSGRVAPKLHLRSLGELSAPSEGLGILTITKY